MQCVLNLVFQYFLIYLLLWIFITVEDLSSGQINLHAAKDAIESAKSTVQFAPMLCILFVATRMRALQMTSNRGAPQGWVQDGMSAFVDHVWFLHGFAALTVCEKVYID